MVLPNATQLYFKGKIEQDAINRKPGFERGDAEKIYQILAQTKPTDLSKESQKQNIRVKDDKVLLEVGQRVINEKKADEVLSLYRFYTKSFPNIIVAWNDMGDVYIMKGNKEKAIKCYEQALQLRPGNQRAKANLDKLK